MRVVGGTLRGRALAGPGNTGTEIRPTSDRLREAIFNVLTHAYEDAVAGARVLDLFAGTGALGIEAMSRGAALAVFVDDASGARGLIRQNIDALGLAGATRLFRRDATRLGTSAGMEPFGLVFCDPPYGRDLAGPALASCAAGGWLEEGALVLVEENAAAAFRLPAGFTEMERRRYAETEFTIGRYAP